MRKLAGYDRLSGVGEAEKLAKLYNFSRLYVNCFQPSFKLKSKTRTGARVSKRYHAPVTPYDRVMAATSIPETMKEHLRVLFHQLDPIELIKGIRCVQEKLNALATLQPAPSEPSSEIFVQKLRIAWHEGEVRPTHRRRKAAVRHWRTRADPLEQVWTRILEQVALTPDITAKDLFHQLQAEHPGRFPKCQLRTLQRRVKHWRSEMAPKPHYQCFRDRRGSAGASSHF